MRPCVASALAASFVLCQVALVILVFNVHDTDTRRGLLEQPGNETSTAAQIERLLSTVEELKGTTEAQQATIAELQAALDERDASHKQELEQLRTTLTASAEQRVKVRGAMRA